MATRIMRGVKDTMSSQQEDTDVIMETARKILASHRLPPRFGMQLPAMKGQPTDLRPIFGNRKPAFQYTREVVSKIFLYMAEGLSFNAARGMAGVGSGTVERWMEAHPTIADLMELGRGLRVARLERELLATQSPVTSNSRLKALANANKEDWGEKSEVNINSTHTFIQAIQEAQLLGRAKPVLIEGAAEEVTPVDLAAEMEQVFG